MDLDLENVQIAVTAGVLAVLWTLEALLPAAVFGPGRVGHDARNLVLGALNALILAVAAAPAFAFVIARADLTGFGLLRWTEASPAAGFAGAILIQDGWMYLWHRMNHRIPLLWRFHRAHHSDPEMDASTAVRFHFGEIAIAGALRLGVIALAGLSLAHVLVYDLLVMPFILFHHSNVRVPEAFDRIYRMLFASPAMHRVHHSPVRCETDSNYSTIFSFWDRIGRSFRQRGLGQTPGFGLDEFAGRETEALGRLVLMPFDRQHSANGEVRPQGISR